MILNYKGGISEDRCMHHNLRSSLATEALSLFELRTSFGAYALNIH